MKVFSLKDSVFDQNLVSFDVKRETNYDKIFILLSL